MFSTLNMTCLSRKWILNGKNVFIVCDVEGKLNEWIKLFRNTLKGYQTLFVIDDCSAEGEINKKRDALSELAFSGRRRNHSLWVLRLLTHVGFLQQNDLILSDMERRKNQEKNIS